MTNLGEGMILDLIRDHNGAVSKSLLEYLVGGNNINKFEKELNELKNYFSNNLIIFNHDMTPKNILVQKLIQRHHDWYL